MYVDYIYYSETYGGKVKEEDFTTLELKASGVLNHYTFNRITEVTENIKLTICELVDFIKENEDKDTKGIASEKVGTHSVTYEKESDRSIQRKQGKIIKRYLSHTNLLYRGI